VREKVNLGEKLESFPEPWSPRTVAQLNGHDVMVVKARDAFVWHRHDDTDDFFLVLKGTLDIELRDRTVTLGPGELFVVPRGVEHRPVARAGEVHLLPIEPTGTPNTGDARTAAPRQLAKARPPPELGPQTSPAASSGRQARPSSRSSGANRAL
jgi:mannose-6-phosphate isomerase-like protein (cupin superfamily)